MTFVGVFFGIVWLALLVYAFYDLAKTKTVSRRAKLAWVLIFVLVPFVGVLVYLFGHVGMGRSPEAALDSFESDVERDRARGI